MNNHIKISVIVPVYNLENEICRCVQSIQKQTFENIEIIVVNDGSKDSSLEKIEQLSEKDKRIIIINKENAGVTSARLEGVRNATGEYIGFVDGDDEIEPEMYEFLLNNAIKYQADISHCGYQMVFDDGRVNCFHNTGCLVQQDTTTGIKDLLDGSLVEPGLCNKLFHKTLLHSLFHHNVMPKDIKINEDLLMNYYLFSYANKSVFEDKCPYHYIVRSGSASRQSLNHHKIYDPIKVKQLILNDINSKNKLHAQKAYLSTCINVYQRLILENDIAYAKETQKIRRFIKEEKQWIKLLCNRQKLMGKLIIYVPIVHKLLYRFYEKYFQKKIYE